MLTEFSLGDVAFDAPNNWSVSEFDGTLELVQDEANGAMHFSFLKRSRSGPTQDSEARLLMGNFASNNGRVPDTEIATGLNSSEARAAGLFHPRAPNPETPLHWLLATVVWQDKVVRVSYCTDVMTEDSVIRVSGIIGSIRRRTA